MMLYDANNNVKEEGRLTLISYIDRSQVCIQVNFFMQFMRFGMFDEVAFLVIWGILINVNELVQSIIELPRRNLRGFF